MESTNISQHLRYKIVESEEMQAFFSSNLLSKPLWKFCDEDDMRILFYDGDIFVGAISCNKRDGCMHIEMIEVPTGLRHKGYASAIVKTLQKEVAHLSCVPIDTSEQLFERCGFRKQTSQTWVWDR